MNRKEYLLICLIEELAEFQQELCKCLRFTLDDDLMGMSNFKKAQEEYSDVLAILLMLKREGIFFEYNADHMDLKRLRVNHTMIHSENVGVLKE